MKRIFLTITFLVIVGSLQAQLTTEKHGWIMRLFFYTVESCPKRLEGNLAEEIIELPFMSQYPDAVAQLDSLITNCRKEYKSIDWALDSLNTDSGPASRLTNSMRREMIYNLYVNQLKLLSKPIRLRKYANYRNAFFDNGGGTTEKGFLNIACMTPLCDAMEYGGPLVVSWSRTSDTLTDSTSAHEAFNKATQDGVIISLFDRPVWNKPSKVVRCAYPFYGATAYHVVATAEYDYRFEEPQRFLRERITYYIFVFIKNGYEYLIAFQGGGGCFNVENLADYLSIN